MPRKKPVPAADPNADLDVHLRHAAEQRRAALLLHGKLNDIRGALATGTLTDDQRERMIELERTTFRELDAISPSMAALHRPWTARE